MDERSPVHKVLHISQRDFQTCKTKSSARSLLFLMTISRLRAWWLAAVGKSVWLTLLGQPFAAPVGLETLICWQNSSLSRQWFFSSALCPFVCLPWAISGFKYAAALKQSCIYWSRALAAIDLARGHIYSALPCVCVHWCVNVFKFNKLKVCPAHIWCESVVIQRDEIYVSLSSHSIVFNGRSIGSGLFYLTLEPFKKLNTWCHPDTL